ncbi:isoprenylcysteine carboxylmethyltransferase family protein [Yoonia sp. R2331]|uniref:methyltransferase family protein n=1 Tax=Yoonia sp. R2331 TaxID=3237238 RepID=UPI0034E596C0
MKWIDLPPIWLLAFAVLTWFSQSVVTLALPKWLGTVLVCVGLALMLAAIWEMQRKRTTVIPHMQPRVLVDTGIFAYSRNPIYLGDALILAGLALRWDAPIGLLLVPVFMWVIHTRFITAEEARLRTAFGPAFDAYAAITRRWV